MIVAGNGPVLHATFHHLALFFLVLARLSSSPLCDLILHPNLTHKPEHGAHLGNRPSY